MACPCLSDDTWFALSQMRTSLTTTLQVEDPHPNSAGMSEYRLEKVFPVYAVGVSEPDPNLIVSVANTASTLGDPIWDAVKLEAKLEVCFFFIKILPFSSFNHCLLTNLTVLILILDAFTRIKTCESLDRKEITILLGFEVALHII